jgi:S1-C subfamily serine protease
MNLIGTWRAIFAEIAGVIPALDFQWHGSSYLRIRLRTGLARGAPAGRTRAAGGARVSRIDTGSPAEEAGLEIGDVIIRFAGNNVNNSAELRQFVAAARPGYRASVDVMRKGHTKSFVVTVAPPESARSPMNP